MKAIVFSFLLSFLFLTASAQRQTKYQAQKNYNLSILIDLSDRIAVGKNQSNITQTERDIRIVSYIVEQFKKQLKELGGIFAEGKLKVFFHPTPQIESIDKIVSLLNIDLASMHPVEKRKVFNTVVSQFESNLRIVYNHTIQQNYFPGSDIWRFFKNDVYDYCVLDDSNYHNILVILTDGYIYHKDSVEKIGNKTTYLTPAFIKREGLRDHHNFDSFFKQTEYGLLAKRNDLQDLNVLVLEISPEANTQKDENIIGVYLSDWFQKMNVGSFKLYSSDLPTNTNIRLNQYFKSLQNE